MSKTNAAAYVETATSGKLIGPDWATNFQICDIINMDPGYGSQIHLFLEVRIIYTYDCWTPFLILFFWQNTNHLFQSHLDEYLRE